MGVPPKILIVSTSPDDRRAAARAAPDGSRVLQTDDCRQARQALESDPDIAVIICDLTLSDGSWWCMYQESVRRQRPAELIVLLPQRGLNAAEVEAHGVTVIGTGPLDSQELAQAILTAAERSNAQSAQLTDR